MYEKKNSSTAPDNVLLYIIGLKNMMRLRKPYVL